jgi:hypothetical protein
MMRRYTANQLTKRRQLGATSLLISVLIMFLAAVLIIGVSRTTTMEQRMSGNELRARQAFEAAQAGLDHAVDYLTSDPLGIDRDENGVADTVVARDNVAPATYRFVYCDPSEQPSCPDSPGYPTCTIGEANFRSPLIVSCGWSDDESGRQMIRQQAEVIPGLGGSPSAPAIAKGVANVSGSATVWNFYTNLTFWTGGSLDSIGNSGKTYIRDPSISPPAASVSPPSPNKQATETGDGDSCGGLCWVESTNKNTTGPDVIADDPALSALTDALMFQNYLGAKDLDSYRVNVADQDISADQAGTLDDNGGVTGEAVVIEGDTTLPNGTIGTRDEPVVLVINGDWLGGNVTVWGVIYVTGNVEVAGNPVVYGAMVAEGNMAGTGSLDIVYDPEAIANASDRTGSSTFAAGSWRDW